MKKAMLDLVFDFLKEKGSATFDQIVEYIKEAYIKDFLIKHGGRKSMEEDKIAELYTLLTIDGRFIMNSNEEWVLVEDFSYNDVRKMKINISDNSNHND